MWPRVWTTDLSYVILLSELHPIFLLFLNILQYLPLWIFFLRRGGGFFNSRRFHYSCIITFFILSTLRRRDLSRQQLESGTAFRLGANITFRSAFFLFFHRPSNVISPPGSSCQLPVDLHFPRLSQRPRASFSGSSAGCQTPFWKASKPRTPRSTRNFSDQSNVSFLKPAPPDHFCAARSEQATRLRQRPASSDPRSTRNLSDQSNVSFEASSSGSSFVQHAPNKPTS